MEGWTMGNMATENAAGNRIEQLLVFYRFLMQEALLRSVAL